MSDSEDLILGTVIPLALTLAAALATGFRLLSAYTDRDAQRKALRFGMLDGVKAEKSRRIVRDSIRREWLRVMKCFVAVAAIIVGYLFTSYRLQLRNWFFAIIALMLLANSILDHYSQRWFLRRSLGDNFRRRYKYGPRGEEEGQ